MEGQPPALQRDHRPTWQLLRTFNPDYRVVFVGDATMSPYEIEQPGGSVEHWNEESGRVWMTRIAAHFPRLVWLNPEPVDRWKWTPSVGITRALIGDRMFPLTLRGLDDAMRELRRGTRRPLPGGIEQLAARHDRLPLDRIALRAGQTKTPGAKTPRRALIVRNERLSQLRGRVRLDLGEHHVRVALRVHLRPVLHDLAVGTDEEGLAARELRGAGAEQHAVLARNLLASGRRGCRTAGCVPSANFLCESTSSTLTPRMTASAFRNAKMLSRSSQAWVVQPRRVVLRVEVEHHPLALVLAQRVPVAFLVL